GFGEHERFTAKATTGRAIGSRHREGASVTLDSGQRFGKHFELGAVGNFDRRPADPFYGIGNGDDASSLPEMPVDPTVDDLAREVKYRYQEARVALTADIKPTDEVRLRLTGALTQLAFEPSSDGVAIDTVYQENALPGFVGGVEHAYGELAVRWDTRDRSTPWESKQIPTRGSLIELFGERVDRLDGGRDFGRYGGELQHFFRLARGPRVLIARVHASGVTGARDDVPFSELPMLGGGDFLRGYSYNRFRDRAAAFGSLQYEWDLSHFTNAYLFTDFGRVWASFEQVTARGLRVGYGIGLDVHGESAFLFTFSVASSIDGGLFLNFAFNQPINGVQRWR
ncbi:MAG: BamA/TamA family outer membrane protein, partial [Kofleriaceae bacterium]